MDASPVAIQQKLTTQCPSDDRLNQSTTLDKRTVIKDLKSYIRKSFLHFLFCFAATVGSDAMLL